MARETFKWVSSSESDFNFDDQASFREDDLKRGPVLYNHAKTKMDMTNREGISAFYKDDRSAIFHTYSCYARGLDPVNGTCHFLDMVPKGRDEGDHPQSWVRHHDKYTD